jgi:arsenate reductase
MATYEIWHNPRCSKSRQTLARLQAAGIEPKIRLYLEDPPSKTALKKVLRLLGMDHPRALMRTKEAVYKELGLAKVEGKEALLEAMVEHPKLIERPVVIKDGKEAVLGRPPEAVDALL